MRGHLIWLVLILFDVRPKAVPSNEVVVNLISISYYVPLRGIGHQASLMWVEGSWSQSKRQEKHEVTKEKKKKQTIPVSGLAELYIQNFGNWTRAACLMPSSVNEQREQPLYITFQTLNFSHPSPPYINSLSTLTLCSIQGTAPRSLEVDCSVAWNPYEVVIWDTNLYRDFSYEFLIANS